MAVFPLFVALVCLVSTFDVLRQTYQRIRKSKNDICYYSIRLQLQELEGIYYLCEANGILTPYPNIRRYFNQIPALLNLGMDEFRKVKFVSAESIDSEYMELFEKEIFKAPKEVLSLLSMSSDCLNQLVAIQHPFRGWKDSCKKKILMRILEFLLEIMKKRSNKAVTDRETVFENRFQKKILEPIDEWPLLSTIT